MGAACYIVCENGEVNEEIIVNGKSVSKHLDHLSSMAQDNGMRRLDSFISQSPEEADRFLLELGAAIDEVKASIKESWYDPSHGLDYFRALASLVTGDDFLDPKDKSDTITDLEEYITAMCTLKDKGLRWHLQIDF